jgi:Tol biopolymer transport system component
MSVAVRVAVRSDQYLDVAWSPTGGRLAVVVARRTGSALELTRPDGTRIRRVMSVDEAASNTREGGMNPSWSPDGRRLTFAAGHGLYVVGADGGHLRRIVTLHGLLPRAAYPSWSTRGRIFFTLVDWGPVMSVPVSVRPDGSGLRVESAQKSKPEEYALAMNSWSPDGRHRARVTQQGIVVMNADGSNPRVLVPQDHPQAVSWPLRWSPDGRLIAFRRYPATQGAQSEADIWIVDARTGEQRAVTQTPEDESAPAWLTGMAHRYGTCPSTRSPSVGGHS